MFDDTNWEQSAEITKTLQVVQLSHCASASAFKICNNQAKYQSK